MPTLDQRMRETGLIGIRELIRGLECSSLKLVMQSQWLARMEGFSQTSTAMHVVVLDIMRWIARVLLVLMLLLLLQLRLRQLLEEQRGR